ncbi:BZ3500_MvSof-1268-A1-R1_Chr7-1g09442 [Microbotryum saponariae]|uniref:BZ3500_MvSof-1268-A1-R1_Chr7-1g09442 protein n=1 Tax=Microbotryum saponariae TaxID=289078 RepID=A0A2X0LJR2_9BASI|nr:BZ3501_MvSof-1269-A2-R1_Chr7-1g09147 [Microbotryum saponariae]SDA03455.1 BZ3500_MvSof-1268-A1-R1_Chr7-1g09442 [Microbotryum saponariae]
MASRASRATAAHCRTGPDHVTSAVHQLVLHPAITSSIKVASTTVGRDKAYRTIQYLARFLAFYTLRKGYTNETVARLTALKSTLGLSRKLMRIGKPFEHLQAAVKSLDVQDPVLKFTALGRQLGYAGYLWNDMLVWVSLYQSFLLPVSLIPALTNLSFNQQAHSSKVRPLSPADAKIVSQRAAKLWFTGISFSLISSIYRLVDLSAREAKARRTRASEQEVERKAELKTVLAQKAAVRTQLVQDGLDILLPAGVLGYHNLDDGVLGLVGVVTSLMGLRSQINKVLGPSVASK